MNRDLDVALKFFSRAPVMQVAACVSGQPLLRTLHGAVVDDAIIFHGSRRGEKSALANASCVISAEETVVRIPSWMIDPQRACPATTYFRSAQAHGVLEEVETVEVKARVLQAFMERFQPEGKHRPIQEDDPMYRGAIRGLRVLRLRPERVSYREKLGQKKSVAVRGRIVAGLWGRGDRGDVEAIDAIVKASPDTPLPFALPDGVQLHLKPTTDHLRQIVPLLVEMYWNQGRFSEAQIREAHLHSDVWLVLTDSQRGRVLATARALSDRSKYAWIYDIYVVPSHRGAGLGGVLMRLLRDHPTLRRCQQLLITMDAQQFYQKHGFVSSAIPAERSLMARGEPGVG